MGEKRHAYVGYSDGEKYYDHMKYQGSVEDQSQVQDQQRERDQNQAKDEDSLKYESNLSSGTGTVCRCRVFEARLEKAMPAYEVG